jgi:hypothetical protein
VKRILGDYFEEAYLVDWRRFIKRLNKSNPLSELWAQCCMQYVFLSASLNFTILISLRVYGKEIILQRDTETRWSSTVSMLSKATKVKHAVDRIFNLTLLEHKEQNV